MSKQRNNGHGEIYIIKKQKEKKSSKVFDENWLLFCFLHNIESVVMLRSSFIYNCLLLCCWDWIRADLGKDLSWHTEIVNLNALRTSEYIWTRNYSIVDGTCFSDLTRFLVPALPFRVVLAVVVEGVVVVVVVVVEVVVLSLIFFPLRCWRSGYRDFY